MWNVNWVDFPWLAMALTAWLWWMWQKGRKQSKLAQPRPQAIRMPTGATEKPHSSPWARSLKAVAVAAIVLVTVAFMAFMVLMGLYLTAIGGTW
jgi:hypothetical protein